jgi:hypothetical protein
MARVRRQKSGVNRVGKFTTVKLDGSEMFTFEPDAPIWSSLKKTQIRLKLKTAPFTIPGAFFRLRPPADVSDEILDEFEDALREAGARSVRILPRLAQPQNVAVGEVVEDDETPLAELLRSTVFEVVGDDDELRGACEQIMSEVGI